MCIRYMVQSYEPYGHDRDRALTSSQRKSERQLQQLGSYEWSSERVRQLSSHFQFILTCCGIPRDTSSPTRARILAHLRIISGHRNLQSTARYTALAPDRFAKFWKD